MAFLIPARCHPNTRVRSAEDLRTYHQTSARIRYLLVQLRISTMIVPQGPHPFQGLCSLDTCEQGPSTQYALHWSCIAILFIKGFHSRLGLRSASPH